MPYDVHTPVYQGPVDVMLHLAMEDRVDVGEVSLAAMVDAYLDHVSRLERLDLEVATEFLLVAAALVALKVRRLLPGPDDIGVDEELEPWEDRDLLLVRLLEAKTYQGAGRALEELATAARRSRPRTAGMEEPFASLVPDALAGVQPEQLRDAFVRAIAAEPAPRVDLDHVAPIRASVRDAVEEVVEQLRALGAVSFRRLTEGLRERLQVIVRFLAVLELYKEGLVEVDQEGSFGELQVRWRGPDEARLWPDAVGEYEG